MTTITAPAPTTTDTRHDPLVLCFGEALMNRIDGPGSEPDSNGVDHPGGASASVACGVARLGTPAAFLGRIGSDPIGHQLLDLFEQRQVGTAALQEDAERPTRLARLKRNAKGDLHFETFLGDQALGFADAAVVPATLAESAKSLLSEHAGCWSAAVHSPAAPARWRWTCC